MGQAQRASEALPGHPSSPELRVQQKPPRAHQRTFYSSKAGLGSLFSITKLETPEKTRVWHIKHQKNPWNCFFSWFCCMILGKQRSSTSFVLPQHFLGGKKASWCVYKSTFLLQTQILQGREWPWSARAEHSSEKPGKIWKSHQKFSFLSMEG